MEKTQTQLILEGEAILDGAYKEINLLIFEIEALENCTFLKKDEKQELIDYRRHVIKRTKESLLKVLINLK